MKTTRTCHANLAIHLAVVASFRTDGLKIVWTVGLLQDSMAEIYCCMVKNYEQGRYECWSKRLVSSIRCSCCSSHSRTTDEPPIDVGHYVTSSAVQHEPMFPVSTQTGNFRLPSLVWFKKAHFLPCLKRMKDEKNAGKHMLYNNRHCLRIAAVPM